MKKLKFSLSVFLTLTMFLNHLPVSVLAVDNYESDTDETVEDSEEYLSDRVEEPDTSSEVAQEEEIYVIGEIEEKREEYIRHFRMSNGSFVAAQYAEPIHFQDTDGVWHDIDNTLIENNGRYVSVNGDVIKSFAASLADDDLFNITYKDYFVGMTLIVPVNDIPVISEEPQDETVQEETAECTDEETEIIKEENSPDDNAESEPASETEIENTDQEEENEQTDRQIEEDDSERYVPVEGTKYAVYKNSSIRAYVENPSEKRIANVSLSDALAYSRTSSRLQYAKDDEKPDFLYENNGYDIKESILIHEKQEDYKYSFMLNLKRLVPELQNDGSVLLKSETEGDIFEIPAPVLKDETGITTDAAKYTLENENGHWILTVEADPEWMNEEERAFPVALDPSVVVRANDNTIYSRYVKSNTPNTAGSDQEIYCGYNTGLGECRIALQIASLPSIPDDCIPTGMGVGFYHTAYYNSTSLSGSSPTTPILIEVHELNNGITNLGSQTWNTLAPKINDLVIDYQKGKAETINSYLQWDISSAGLKWYQNGNTDRGLIFIAPDAQAQGKNAKFNGKESEYNQPALIVSYRGAIGLESYYSYQEASAGRAGSLTVSDFTNQMTAVHTDLTFSSEVTPFTLSHVYNSEHAKKQFSSTDGINTKNFSSMVIGSGWKLSAQQTVISKTIGDTDYLIFNDADGTDHYFQETESNTYADEDGLNLKITVNGETYTMTDEDANNTWTFYNGYLISHQDLVGNKIYYAYNSNYSSSNSLWKPGTGNTNRMVQIVSVPVGQGATTICTFGYTGNNLTSITDYAGRTTSYSISTESNRKNLKYIQYSDGNQSCYEYNSGNGWMNLIYDAEAQYGLEITQRNRLGSLSIDRIREYTSPSVSGTKTYGNAFHAYRNSLSLTSYRFYGPDHTYDIEGGTGDDTVLYVVLDHWGRSICSYETDSAKTIMLGTSAGSYTTNSGTDKKNNRLTSASVLGMQVENIIIDGGAELGNTSWWHPYGTSSMASASVTSVSSETHIGNGSLKCEITDNNPSNQAVSFYQDCYLEQGKEYVFSGYINTDFSIVPSSSKGAYLQISTISGTQVHKSTVINYSTYMSQDGDGIDNYDGGWEKVSVSFTPQTTGNYRLSFVLDGVKGSAYADDFQLERRSADCVLNESIGAASTNLLTYGSFDGRFQEVIFDWDGSDFVSAGSNFLFGTYCVETTGNTGAQQRLTQTVPVNRNSEDLTFVLSGWGKADSIASAVTEPDETCWRYFGLIATINYSDNTSEDHYVSFSPDYSDWQYASGNIVPKKSNKTVKSITVSCAYDYNANSAYFDNICLIREPMQTYSYDSDGKLVSAKDGDAQSSVTYVSGTHRPQSYTTASGLTHTLTYTSNHLLATDTVSDLVTTNTYSSAGNITKQKVKSTQSAAYLETRNTYTSNYHYLTSSIDSNDVTSTFSYNSQRNLQNTQTGDNDIQRYSYFTGSDRLQQTYINGKASITYTYGNGALTQLQRKSYSDTDDIYQRYNLTNDSFGNTTGISVSGSSDGNTFSAPITLADYEFENNVNNGRLKTLTWSNGDSVTYSYDMFDRVTDETYAGTVTGTYDYVYDAMGYLSEKNATFGNDTEKHTYQYDGLGRLYHSSAYVNGDQSLTTSYLYDIDDRLKQQSWTIGTDAGFTEKYTYSNSDSTLSSFDVSVSEPGIDSSMDEITTSYTYTSLRQIQRKTIRYDNSNQFYRAFAYHKINSSNQTTNQVEYMNYRMPDGTLINGNKYNYDNTGRISSIIPMSTSGLDTSKTVTYTYDTMSQLTGCVDQRNGNTVTYTYSYDTAGNILNSTGDTAKTYYYENTSWPDLLTKISIGNTTESITYPVSNGMVTAGTPLTWYNGNSYTFTWKKGTQLAAAVKDGITTSYSYDMDGIRNSKTVGNTVYHFDTLSGKVMHQTGASRELWFIYDENGQPFMLITKEGTEINEYWYLINAVGDVVGLMNSSQQIVAEYSYDPFGRIVSEWTDTDDNVGTVNPLRYRSYYYDTETGFYYLESRYYDPAIGRFISADTFAATNGGDFLSCNMFAYCGNDPVNRIDESGKYWFAAATCIVGFIVGGVSQIATNALEGKDVSQWGEGVIGAAFGGAAYGLIGALKLEIHAFPVASIVAGFAAALAETIVNDVVAYDHGISRSSSDNIFTDIGNFLVDGSLYAVTGTIASQVIPTTFGGKDTVEFLTQGVEMGKAWGQSIYQSSMVMINNIGNTISNRYLTPKKAQRKTSKKVYKPASRRSTRPMALVA